MSKRLAVLKSHDSPGECSAWIVPEIPSVSNSFSLLTMGVGVLELILIEGSDGTFYVKKFVQDFAEPDLPGA
jgi:hypothetical protein